MKKTCKEIADLLVDYADSQLSGGIVKEVTEHLESCPACRAKVKALDKSLGLAQVVWRDYEERNSFAPTGLRLFSHNIPTTKVMGYFLSPLRGIKLRYPHWIRYSIAAGIILIAGFAAVWKIYIQSPQPTLEKIQYDISQAAMAAQLLTAADIVAGQKGGEEIAKEQYLYISQNYQNTPYAKEALAKIKSN